MDINVAEVTEVLEKMCQAFWDYGRVPGEPDWNDYVETDLPGAKMVRGKMAMALKAFNEGMVPLVKEQERKKAIVKNDKLSYSTAVPLVSLLSLQANQIGMQEVYHDLGKYIHSQNVVIGKLRMALIKEQIAHVGEDKEGEQS